MSRVGEGVIMHTLGKVDGIEYLDAVVVFLQQPAALDYDAAFRDSLVKIENGSVTDNFHFRN